MRITFSTDPIRQDIFVRLTAEPRVKELAQTIPLR
jgi:hypothetical protein